MATRSQSQNIRRVEGLTMIERCSECWYMTGHSPYCPNNIKNLVKSWIKEKLRLSGGEARPLERKA